MNEITIRAEMTYQEYRASQNELLYGHGMRLAAWAIVAIGATCLASSAALTWGTAASILAGVALAALTFSLLLSGQVSAKRGRRAYERYRSANTSYTFTNEGIYAKWRSGQRYVAWVEVDRLIEMKNIYLLDVVSFYIGVPKRQIPAHNVDDFIQLLRTHHLLRQP